MVYDTSTLNNATLTGDTHIMGQVTIQDPVTDTCAATKRYVDKYITSGVYPKQSVRVATTRPFDKEENAVYSGNDTITFHNVYSLVIDSVEVGLNDRVLVKDEIEPNNVYNGVYVVCSVSPVIFIRTADALYDSLIMKSGYYVETGQINAKTLWVCTNVVLTVGIDPICYTQFSTVGTPTITNVGAGPGVYSDKSVGSEIWLKGIRRRSEKVIVTADDTDVLIDVDPAMLNVNDLNGTLDVGHGGTGINTIVPNGHILVGNGTSGRLGTLVPPTGDLVGTDSAQLLRNKTFDNLLLKGPVTPENKTIISPSNAKSNVFVYLPSESGPLVNESMPQSLYNKTIDISNTVTASYLKSFGDGKIELVTGQTPVAGQVLTMISSDKAAWMTTANTSPTNNGNNGNSINNGNKVPSYITTKMLTFNVGVWERLTTNPRGAGQIIFSCVKNDMSSQLIVFVAKSNSKINEFTTNVLCETLNGIQLRWNAGNGVEAKGTGEYVITIIGMIGT